MESPGGMSDGGVGIEPWKIPRFGSSVGGSGRGIGQAAGGTSIGTSQGLGSTGIGGGFAQWPGTMEAPWQHRGLYGGLGDRTGSAT
jgi:hypothetical protein